MGCGWQVNTEEYPFTDYKPNEQSSVHLEAEADKKELPEEPVKEGYIFKGWYVSPGKRICNLLFSSVEFFIMVSASA